MPSALKNFLITFGISALVFGLAAYFTVSYALGAAAGPAPEPGETTETTAPDGTGDDPAADDNYPEVSGTSFNVLLIGTDLQANRFDDYDPGLWLWSDSRHHLKSVSEQTKDMQTGLFRYRTPEADSLLVLRVDKERHAFTYTYIPGCTRVLSEGGNIELGSLYADKGVDFLRQKVEAITGLDIEYYVCMSVDNIAEAVNTIGAVTFDVPCNMEYEDPVQELTIKITKGTKTIGGTGAAQLLRFNQYTDAGNTRGTVTVKFLMALMSRATEAFNATSIPTLYSKLAPLVDTNLTAEFLVANADLLFVYPKYQCYEMAYPGAYGRNDSGEQIFNPEIKNAIDMFYSHRLPVGGAQ